MGFWFRVAGASKRSLFWSASVPARLRADSSPRCEFLKKCGSSFRVLICWILLFWVHTLIFGKSSAQGCSKKAGLGSSRSKFGLSVG